MLSLELGVRARGLCRRPHIFVKQAGACGSMVCHRMVRVGRDLCGSPSPTPLPKQGHPEQAVEDLVQAGLEYLQRRRLHNLPGQPVPVLRHPQREEVLPYRLSYRCLSQIMLCVQACVNFWAWTLWRMTCTMPDMTIWASHMALYHHLSSWGSHLSSLGSAVCKSR